jgi:hypothetical protein
MLGLRRQAPRDVSSLLVEDPKVEIDSATASASFKDQKLTQL